MKVTELKEAELIENSDIMMIVQNGENKKVGLNKFVKVGDKVDANTLNGVDGTKFVQKNEKGINMAEGLGGLPASNYATKKYVDDKLGNDTSVASEAWCAPIMWFDNTIMPDGLTQTTGSKWRVCDGQALDKNEYPELFEIIGYRFTRDVNGVMLGDSSSIYNIPNMCGRMPIGAVSTEQTTENLPYYLYSSEDRNLFDARGQWRYPSEAGLKGGDPTTTQASILQLVKHSHKYKRLSVAEAGEAKSEAYYRVYKDDINATTDDSGENTQENNQYPNNPLVNENNFNYGMLSISPYLSFVFVMKVKP